MKAYRGLAASAGIAIGPAFLYTSEQKHSKPSSERVDAASELNRIERAIAEAQKQLKNLQEKAAAEMEKEMAAIFLAQQEFLSDPGLLDEIKEQIKERCLPAEIAVEAAFEGYARQLEMSEDQYYRERALDLRDVSRRVQRILAGVLDKLTTLTSPVIIVARDLTPSDIAQMDKSMILGFCTATGGLTSHTALIARALGIPAVVGIGEDVLELTTGTTLIIDGYTGTVLANADEAAIMEYSRQQNVQVKKQAREKVEAYKPALTKDGHYVEILANIADAASAHMVLDFGAEGIGLFRTEYLFLNCQDAPTEEEQYREYRAVADLLGDRPLTIRTLDLGGDKQLPYLGIGREMNPFLGWRGIRLCLDSPQIFEPQLRAILRAGVDRNVRIMFPMVATLDELQRAREIIERLKSQLAVEGIPFGAQTQIGIMVEVPSAALVIDILAPEVDFFSIGTNDLIQYTMACDRVNEKVASLYDPLHPAMLRLIANVIRTAHDMGKPVGMCGEMASDLEAIPLLLGLGLDEFSMNALAIPAAKALIRSLTMSQAQEIAHNALCKRTAKEIREYLRSLKLARS